MPPEEEKEELKSMSLGDHLEELRARLVLGLLGLFVGMIVCLFFGKALIGVMSRPFEQQIQKMRKLKEVYVLDDEPVKASQNVQAVVVTHNEDGYTTYESHISIADLLARMEKAPVEDGSGTDKADPSEPSPVTAPDACVPDAAVPDAAVPDACVPDAAVPDAAVPDAAVPDATASDAAVSQPEQVDSSPASDAAAGESKPELTDAKVKPKKAKKETNLLRVQEAAVIAHHPKTGFVVYTTAQQVGGELQKLIDAGVLVESGAAVSKALPTAALVTLAPVEGFMVYMKTSMLFGALATSPWLIWQIWAFVSAGLYRREKKYVHTVAPISGALFITGGLFFMLVVAPMVMKFLIRFNAAMGVQSTWGLEKYFNLVFSMTLIFGAAFQMPIALVFAERLGLISLDVMKRNRKYVILGIFVVAAVATPPDAISQISLAIPLYLLYEASIVVCQVWRTRRERAAAGT